MSKMKKVIMMAILVGIIGIGGTFAFLASTTNVITNTFTSSRNIKIELREPKWDGYEFGQEYQGIPGVDKNPDIGSTPVGLDIANNYMPSDTITKNPTLKNISTSDKAYVAIKVEFIDHNNQNITRETFESNYASLDISNSFTLINSASIAHDGYALYIFNTVLDANQVSNELFTRVKINEDIKVLSDGYLPQFSIKTTGYGVQAVGLNSEEAKTAILDLATN